jgi:hypothetical protein
MQTQTLDILPLWAVFAATTALVLCFVESGFRLGMAKRRRAADVKEAAVGSMVGATLGLLAFMLAFTFGLAAARYDIRRNLVLDEANAVQTAYLRTAFLAPPQQAAIRSLLREYVEVRLDWAGQQDLQKVLTRSEAIQGQLWSQAVAVGEESPGSIVVGLFIHTVNEVIDLHAKRVQAGQRSRIPTVILYVLFFLTALAMTSMGYLAGIAGKRTNLVTLTLVLAFSSVMFLIVDLDRPQEGLLKVTQQPLIDLRETMVPPLPERK